jgi:thiamine biosynthesis lipoprotein
MSHIGCETVGPDRIAALKATGNLPYRYFRAIVVQLAIGLALLDGGCGEPGLTSGLVPNKLSLPQTVVAKPRLFELKRPAMGVQLSIQVWCDDQQQASAAMLDAAARVEQLEQVLSNYRDASEVSKLTASLSRGPVVVSDDLWRVFSLSREAWTLSGKAFDVTIGPLADLWRAARKSRQLPESVALDAARQRTGLDQLTFNETNRSLDSDGRPIEFDFGAIGKGFAADEALAVLRQHGLEAGLVELGGDMAVGAPPPGKRGWRIAIDSFESGTGPALYMEICRCGIATSGDKHQFVEIDGVRYSHIIDPRSGMALQRSSLVTVVAPDGVQADMLASICSLLDEEQALKISASRPGTYVRGEVASGSGERALFASPDFPELKRIAR